MNFDCRSITGTEMFTLTSAVENMIKSDGECGVIKDGLLNDLWDTFLTNSEAVFSLSAQPGAAGWHAIDPTDNVHQIWLREDVLMGNQADMAMKLFHEGRHHAGHRHSSGQNFSDENSAWQVCKVSEF